MASSVRNQLPADQLRLFEVANERGASTWLTALPLKEYGFDLHKEEFRDALCLRYGWQPSDLPLTCVCGESYTVAHSLMCLYGGFVTLRHNDIRDLSASLLKEVCPNVCREPILQPLTGESLRLRSASTDDGAHLDISAEGFWGHHYQHVFFDVRVFCPLSSTSSSQSLLACYRTNEEIKKRKYDQRIREVALLWSFLHLVALDRYPPCSLSGWHSYIRRNSNVRTVQQLISSAVASPSLF